MHRYICELFFLNAVEYIAPDPRWASGESVLCRERFILEIVDLSFISEIYDPRLICWVQNVILLARKAHPPEKPALEAALNKEFKQALMDDGYFGVRTSDFVTFSDSEDEEETEEELTPASKALLQRAVAYYAFIKALDTQASNLHDASVLASISLNPAPEEKIIYPDIFRSIYQGEMIIGHALEKFLNLLEKSIRKRLDRPAKWCPDEVELTSAYWNGLVRIIYEEISGISGKTWVQGPAFLHAVLYGSRERCFEALKNTQWPIDYEDEALHTQRGWEWSVDTDYEEGLVEVFDVLSSVEMEDLEGLRPFGRVDSVRDWREYEVYQWETYHIYNDGNYRQYD